MASKCLEQRELLRCSNFLVGVAGLHSHALCREIKEGMKKKTLSDKGENVDKWGGQ
jgi:hypothetical protein